MPRVLCRVLLLEHNLREKSITGASHPSSKLSPVPVRRSLRRIHNRPRGAILAVVPGAQTFAGQCWFADDGVAEVVDPEASAAKGRAKRTRKTSSRHLAALSQRNEKEGGFAMLYPGPKGNARLREIEKDLKDSDSAKQILKNVPGSTLELVYTRLEITILGQTAPQEKAVPCRFPVPDECKCIQSTYLVKYRITYTVLLFVVSPNIVGWDPRVQKMVQGRTYEGMSTGYLTIFNEVITDVRLDCPPGMSDLPPLPGTFASLTGHTDEWLAQQATIQLGAGGYVAEEQHEHWVRATPIEMANELPWQIPTGAFVALADEGKALLASDAFPRYPQLFDELGAHLTRALGALKRGEDKA